MSKKEFVDNLKYTQAELFVRDVEALFVNPINTHFAYLNDVFNSSKDPRPALMCQRDNFLGYAERWIEQGDSPKQFYGWLLCEFALKGIAKAVAKRTEKGFKVDCCGTLCEFEKYENDEQDVEPYVGLVYVEDDHFNESELPLYTVEQIVEEY